MVLGGGPVHLQGLHLEPRGAGPVRLVVVVAGVGVAAVSAAVSVAALPFVRRFVRVGREMHYTVVRRQLLLLVRVVLADVRVGGFPESERHRSSW